MRNRDIFLPSLSSLLIFGMAMFLSCAHQNRVNDGLDAEAGTETSSEEASTKEEGSSTAEAPKETSDLAKLSEVTGAQTESAVTDSTQATQNTTDLTALGAAPDEKSLKAQTEGGANTASVLSTQPVEDVANPAVTEVAKTTTELEPITGSETGAISTITEKKSDSPVPSEPVSQETLATTESIPTAAPLEEPAALSPQKHQREARVSSHSRVPKIPSKAVKRAGVSLNRFYFLRKGDTPKSVSTLLYGESNKALSLSKWNGKGWEAGKIVFYSSPIDARDKKMRSFYQEKNVQPDEYTIQRSDWLSKISKKNLGSAKSWKEIAVVNGLASPDSIEIGQKIAIYPKDLSSYSGQQQPPQAQPTDPNLEQENPVIPEQPVAQSPQKILKQQPVDVSKLVEQNLPAVAILGLVVVLSGLYLIVRKKKTARSLDEFNDDNFAAPTKLKRK